ncbi:MAG: hypothetical protein E7Z84_02165 [Methanosphaera stadtmanae]|nr:hypothetical protein [Methanosphaera stadtmanae]
MNINEILGKKIIDKNIKDLAKIAEMTFNTETFKISKIYGSVGNPLSKKYYPIEPSEIIGFGDYLQVSLTQEDCEKNKLDKIPTSEEKDATINEIIGKKVLNTKGNDNGRVSGINLDFEEKIITGLTIELPNTSSFGKKNIMTITKNDIAGIGDYILINKVIKSEETEDKKEETEDKEEETEDEEEKVEVSIE